MTFGIVLGRLESFGIGGRLGGYLGDLFGKKASVWRLSRQKGVILETCSSIRYHFGDLFVKSASCWCLFRPKFVCCGLWCGRAWPNPFSVEDSH